MKAAILQVIDSFHQGGTERQAVQLTRMLHDTGRYTLHVACLTNEGILKEDIERLGLGPIHAFPTISFYHPSIVRQVARFIRMLRRLKIDLVHTHDFYTNILGMAAATLAGVPRRVASRRETDPGRTPSQRWVERRAFAAAHGIVVNADAIGADLVAHGVSAAKIRTVYNGLDPGRFQMTTGTHQERLAAFGIPDHRRVVTILANLWLVLKDHPTFLRAAAKVHAAAPDTAFVVAGEGSLLEPLRQLAADLGIADHVHFIGRCQNVADLLSVSDIGVLSSVSEGFPNVLIEYMAAGLPVITTDVGGAREAVSDGKTGFVVPPRDADAMAGRILRLLADPGERVTMGALARQIAWEKFSCAAQLAGVERLYEQLFAAAPVSRGNRPSERPAHPPESAGGTEDIARRPAASRAS
jgi:glycosyltransferase involved in cell wall biosynthesis